MAHSERARHELPLVEGLVLALVVFPPLAFGGKSDLFSSLTNFFGVVLLALTWFVYRRRGPAQPVTRRKLVYPEPWPALALLAAFVLLHVAQLAPLPSGLVRLLAGWRPDTSWAALTPYPEATLRALLSWLPALAVFAAITLLYDTRGQVRRLLLVLFTLATLISLYGLMETLSGREMIWNLPKLAYRGTVTGTFVNRNNFAAFISLGLGAGLGVGLYRRSKMTAATKADGSLERLVLLSFMGVICLVGLLLSKSRGGLGSLVLVGLPVAWWLVGRRSRRAFAVFAVALLALAIGLGAWVGHEPLTDRFAELPQEAAAPDARPAAWLAGARIAVRAWPLGVGAGTFVDHFRMVSGTGILARYNHAHCDPLEFLAETGILGLLAIYGAIAWLWWATWSAWNERHSRFARFLSIGCLVGSAAVLFHSLFDFPLQVPGVRIPLFAVLGAAYVAAHRRLTR